jgi:hypothetical protein
MMPPNLEEIFFNVYVLYHQMQMDVSLFKNIYLLLEKQMERNFVNRLDSFPSVKLKAIQNGLVDNNKMMNFGKSSFTGKQNKISLRLNYENPLLKYMRQNQNKNKNIDSNSLNYNENEDNKSLPIVEFKKIKNKIHFNLKTISNNNIQEMFRQFLQTYYKKIFLFYTILCEKEFFLTLSYIKNNTILQLEWSYEINNFEDMRKNKECLMIIKYLECFIKLLIESQNENEM